jgi:hypothetical protein
MRRRLWVGHGCTAALYGDDGEMQCNDASRHQGFLDFKRQPLPDLFDALRRMWRRDIDKAVAERDAARAELAKLKSDIDRFWFYVEHAYDIEPRSYFEGNPPDASVFGSPLAQAAHHIWKRDPKVQSAKAEGAREALAQVQAKWYASSEFEFEEWLRARAQGGT